VFKEEEKNGSKISSAQSAHFSLGIYSLFWKTCFIMLKYSTVELGSIFSFNIFLLQYFSANSFVDLNIFL
jgi:hypothetical protein